MTEPSNKKLIAQLEKEITALIQKYNRAKADRQKLQSCFYCKCQCKQQQQNSTTGGN